MGEFKKRGGFGGDRSGGFGGGDRGGFGGKPRFGRAPHGNRNFGPREMFSTVCAKCGQTCEVPFRPNGEKPVYCNTCFGKNGGGDFSPRPAKFGAPSSGYSAPVSRPQADNGQITDLKRQVNDISMKLDKIMAMLAPKTESGVVSDVRVASDVLDASAVVVAKKAKTKTKSKK